MTFWNININKFKRSSWTTFTGTTTTRTMNGPHYYHTNDGWGTGLGKGRDNKGSRSSRHDTSWASQYGFFFLLLLIFYLLNFYLHLELPQWRVIDDNLPPPPHTISIPKMNAGLRRICVSSSGMLNFFCPLLNDYIFLDCVQNHNQDDNGEWPLPLGQWMGTQDASSVSRVSGMFFYFFRYIFSFFFFY